MIAEAIFGSISFLLVVLVLTIALCAKTDEKTEEKTDEKTEEKPKDEEKNKQEDEEKPKPEPVKEEPKEKPHDEEESEFSSLAQISENVKYLVLKGSNKDAQNANGNMADEDDSADSDTESGNKSENA